MQMELFPKPFSTAETVLSIVVAAFLLLSPFLIFIVFLIAELAHE
jgi:hypothetical protein